MTRRWIASAIAGLSVAAAAMLGLAGCAGAEGCEAAVGENAAGTIAISHGTVGNVDGVSVGLIEVRCESGEPVARASVLESSGADTREVELRAGRSIELADGRELMATSIRSQDGGSVSVQVSSGS